MNKHDECIVVNYGFSSEKWLRPLFKAIVSVSPHSVGKFVCKNSVVVFEGGEDVSPRFYGQPHGSQTRTNPERDSLEHAAFLRAHHAGASFLGICRGAQFLTAMAGGKLVQHVTGHGHWHDVKTNNDETLLASSTHHQMMFPFHMPTEDYHLLAWSAPARSVTYLDGSDDDTLIPPYEPEIVYYPKIRALCIQAHPEWHRSPDDPFVKHCRKLVQNFLIDGGS